MPMSPVGKTRLHCGEQSTPVGASGIHYTGRCAFLEILVTPDGTNNVTINIYDNIAASGERIGNQNMVILGTERVWAYAPVLPRLCKKGIYIKIAVAGGGTCEASAEYDTGLVEG